MKVMMIGPNLNAKGGIASVANGLVEYHDWGDCEIDYYPTSCFEKKSNKHIQFAGALLKISIKMHKYDIIHIHTSSRGSWIRKSIVHHIAKCLKKKTIIHIHSGEFLNFYRQSKHFFIKEDIRQTLRKADCVIVLSPEWKKNIDYIIGYEKSVILKNSVAVNSVVNKDYSCLNMLYLGAINSNKGIFELIESLSRLKILHPSLKLDIGGSGEVERMKKMITQLQLEDNVVFHGWVDSKKKTELLESATVFVLNSKNEGLPMSILEAMSYAIPIISTNVGGIPSLISNQVEGILIPSRDSKSLEDAITQLLSSESMRSKMGKSAYTRVKSEFDISIISLTLKGLYQQLNEVI